MNDFDPLTRSTRKAMAQTTAIVCVAIALLCAIVWSYSYFDKNRAKPVDFDDLFTGESTDADASTDDRPVLRVAVAAMISPKITKHYYEDLLRLVGDSLGRRVEFLQRKTYAEANDLLERKEVDVAFVCSGPYVLGHKQFGMEILVVPVVDGGKVYYCYILAQRDSPVASLEDLKGKSFAFTDPHSNTGCLVPKYMLYQHGDNPKYFFGETSYTYSHDNSIKAVAEGVADGAAVDSLIWDFINATDPTYTSRTKIVGKSPPYGIPPVAVHPEMDPGLKKQLHEAFLSLHEQPEGARILNRLHIERFEDGDDSTYDSVREMESWMENFEKTITKPQVK